MYLYGGFTVKKEHIFFWFVIQKWQNTYYCVFFV